MENTDLKEKPCIFLLFTPHHDGPLISTIPAVKPRRSQVDCLCDEDKDCPKTKNKRDLSMHCFRIRRAKRKAKGRK